MSDLGTMCCQYLILFVVFSSVCSTTVQGQITCRRDNSVPCRVRLTNHTHNDVLREKETCRCYNDWACKSDWTPSKHILELNMTGLLYPMEWKMMFCEPIDDRRLCGPSEVSLRLSGQRNKATNVDYFNCRCPGHIDLRTFAYPPGRMTYDYMCGFPPPCKPDQIVATHTMESTVGHCRCLPPMIRESVSADNFTPRCRSPK